MQQSVILVLSATNSDMSTIVRILPASMAGSLLRCRIKRDSAKVIFKP